MSFSHINIGISGHRDIRNEDMDRLEQELSNKFTELLQKYQSKTLRLIVGNAEGVDTIVRKIAQHNNRLAIAKLEELVVNNSGLSGSVYSDEYYGLQADYLVHHADEMIVAWDGIFNFKMGGTSEVVRKGLEKQKIIHHLVTPRKSNLFAINSLAENAIDYSAKQFRRVPFTVNFTWTVKQQNKIGVKKKTLAEKLSGFVSKVFLNPLSLNYFFPIGLSVTTIFLGTIGFSEMYGGALSDNFFRSVNLLTFNNSVLEDGKSSNFFFQIARFVGLLTVIYAFAYALNLALKSKKDYLRRRWWRRRKDGFILILGLNDKSLDLIYDLTSDKKNRVVLLTEHTDSVYDDELKQIGNLIVVRGSLSSATMLKSLYVLQAVEVFIMSDNDTKNIRAAQEIDILYLQTAPVKDHQLYIHVQKENYAKFLRSSLHTIKNNTYIFNIFENTVRRLFLHFPPDRFHQSVTAHTTHSVIIGYDEIGQQVLLTLLKQGHYQQDKSLRITIYCRNAEQCKADFAAQYPLFYQSETERPEILSIQRETWKRIHLEFLELPGSDTDWLKNSQPLYTNLSDKRIMNIYSCVADGIESAASLNIVLPKLNYLKNETACDIQVFCYYNFTDKKEEENIENYFNRLAPDLFVKCFGNYIIECSAGAIRSMSLSEVGKIINAFYSDADTMKKISADIHQWPLIKHERKDELWHDTTPKDRLSSLQAGDHLWTKLKIIHNMTGWNFNKPDYTLTTEQLQQLGEIEHRRWSAELLLQGFVPFDIATGTEAYKQKVREWKNKGFKNISQNIRQHINLVPFEALEDSESQKDYNQIIAIPYFLKNILTE